MKLSSLATVALASTASAQFSDKICDRYAQAFYGSATAQAEYQLVVLLVNTALAGNFTGPGTNHSYLPGSTVRVNGILNPGTYNGEPVDLTPYFDGSLVSSTQGTGNDTVAVATNWLDGGGVEAIKANPLSDPSKPLKTNQARLQDHLYKYLGGLLGCSYYGSGTDFPAYDGEVSMYTAHKYMNIGPTEFGYFIQQLTLAATSFDVPDNAIAEAATLVLQSVYGQRCLAPAIPYSFPQKQKTLNSICLNAKCPVASNGTCALYSNVSAPATAVRTAPTPAKTSSIAGGRLSVDGVSLGGLTAAILGCFLLI